MSTYLWAAIIIQIAMGAFDTLYHHEATERLAWRASQRLELKLHGVRNIIYGALFLTLGWAVPQGVWALAIITLLLIELIITLWDFVEEDRSRKLPASERINHTLLTLNYGVILALLLPWLWANAALATLLATANNGWLAIFCTISAAGVIIAGLRDLDAAERTSRLTELPPGQLAEALISQSHILITGGTGFVGSLLVHSLLAGGHQVTMLTRRPDRATKNGEIAQFRVVGHLDEIANHQRFDAIVNLAGEPISNGLWTVAKRRKILASRLAVTREVTRLITRLRHKPPVLISGSAIGWYGLRGQEVLGEGAKGRACFSRRLCVAWENAACTSQSEGVRVVLLRTGLVFDRDGGMLARLLLPFEFGLGGKIGNGRQYWSWIHRADLVRLIIHCIAAPALSGPVNATAPSPASNADFTKSLARALHRPALLPLPALPLRIALGDFAKELFLGGQRVVPAAAMASGFTFLYPHLDTALAQICGTRLRAKKRPQAAYDYRPLEGRLLH